MRPRELLDPWVFLDLFRERQESPNSHTSCDIWGGQAMASGCQRSTDSLVHRWNIPSHIDPSWFSHYLWEVADRMRICGIWYREVSYMLDPLTFLFLLFLLFLFFQYMEVLPSGSQRSTDCSGSSVQDSISRSLSSENPESCVQHSFRVLLTRFCTVLRYLAGTTDSWRTWITKSWTSTSTVDTTGRYRTVVPYNQGMMGPGAPTIWLIAFCHRLNFDTLSKHVMY